MRKDFLKLVLVGLFAVSIGTVGVVFAGVAWGGPALPKCPACNKLDLTCVGSTCSCQWDGYDYYCTLLQ
jgi:hypothetical protein